VIANSFHKIDEKVVSSCLLQYKPIDNRLYRVYKHSTGCQTHLTTGLTTGCSVYTAGCETGCTTRFDNRFNEQWLFVQHGCQTGWTFVYTIQSVVSCKQGLNYWLWSVDTDITSRLWVKCRTAACGMRKVKCKMERVARWWLGCYVTPRDHSYSAFHRMPCVYCVEVNCILSMQRIAFCTVHATYVCVLSNQPKEGCRQLILLNCNLSQNLTFTLMTSRTLLPLWEINL